MKRWHRWGTQIALIVVSVLLALSADAWRSRSRERQLERDYLVSLRDEIEVNRRQANSVDQFHQHVLKAARAAYPVIASSQHPIADTVQFLRDAYDASRTQLLSYEDDAFRELTTTGNIRMIKDHELRRALFSYDRRLRVITPLDLLSLDYRDQIRRLFDPELQLRMRDCRLGEACEKPLDIPDHAILTRKLHGNDEVRGALALVIQQWAVGQTQVFPRHLASMDTLSKHIDRYLNK